MRIFVLVGLTIFFIGCSENKSDNSAIANKDEFRVFDLNIESEKVKITDLIDNVEVIQLEETSDGLIGEVRQLFYDQNKFVVNDGADHLYVYTDEGEFISKVDRKGGGPIEYGAIQSFWLKRDTLLIYDIWRKSLKQYDLYGTYLGEVRVPIRVSHLYPNDTEYIGDMDRASLATDQRFNLIFFDHNFSKVTQSVPFKDSIPFPGLAKNNFDLYGNKVVYKETFGDTVYIIDGRSTSPLLKLNFGEEYFWNDTEMIRDGNRALIEINRREKVWYLDAEVGSRKVYISVSTSFSDSGLMQFLLDRSTGDLVKIDLRKSNEEKYSISPLMWKEGALLVSLPTYDLEQITQALAPSKIQLRGGSNLESIINSENPVLAWIKFNNDYQ